MRTRERFFPNLYCFVSATPTSSLCLIVHRAIKKLCPLVLLGFLTVASVRASAQDTYIIWEYYQPGDVYEEDYSSKTDFTIHAQVNGVEVKKAMYGSRRHEKHTERVLSADRSGRVDGLQVAYSAAHRVEITPDGDVGNYSSFLGKVVSLHRIGEKVTVTADKGKIDDDDKATLIDHMLKIGGSYFSIPVNEVALGAEWPINMEPIIQGLSSPKGSSGNGTAKFVGIVDNQGHKCAHVHAVMTLHVQYLGASAPELMELEGDLYLALDIHKLMSLFINGPNSIPPHRIASDAEIKITGSGSTDINLVREYKHLGAKPFPIPRKSRTDA